MKHNEGRVQDVKKSQRFRALTGLNYNDARVEPGDELPELPDDDQLESWLADGSIEEVS